jgi:DNA-binding beta-propeller fold protein YncE
MVRPRAGRSKWWSSTRACGGRSPRFFRTRAWRGNLLPGRTADEAVADWAGNLFGLAIDGDGVRIREELFVGFPTGTQPNGVRVGDLLYRGSGEVFSLMPLQRLDYRPAGPAVAVAEGGRALAYLDSGGGFRVFARTGGAVRGGHAVPWPGGGGAAARFAAWSDSGFAALTADRAWLVSWRSPLLGFPGADLAIAGTGAERVEVGLTNGFPVAGPVAWTWTVTNRGPAAAHGVVVTLDTGASHALGSLAPGESRRVSDLRGVPAPAILRGSASVTSGTPDPRADNDTAWLRTDLLGPSVPGVREWILDARHLAASADGQRLWVAVAPPAREGGPGVLEIDPASGLVHRRLSTEIEPRQVAPSADGGFLYLRLGTSRVGRWNLAADAFDLDLAFEDETVTEILPLPGSGRSVVVSTTRRVVVFDDAVARPDSIADSAERRHLGLARDRLWIAQPGQLRGGVVTATGLRVEGDGFPLFVPTDVYAFASDDRRLYFPGVCFDLEARQTLPAPIGGPFLPEPARQALYAPSGRDLFRYDAATLGLLATERIPTLDTTPVGLARWGADGLAVLYHSGQLRLSRTPVVPEPGGGNLSVRIVPPPAPTAFVPTEWLVVATNHSDQAAARVRLVVQTSGDHRDAGFDVPPDLAMLGEAFRDLGTLAPQAGVTWRFRASVFPGNFTLRAVLVSAAAGDLPGDNLAESTAYFGFPFGELAASLVSAPRQVGPGEVFPVRFRVANTGTVPAANVGLQLTGPAGLEFVSIEPGSPAADCCGERIEARIGSVAPGAVLDVEVRLRTRRPGLGLVALTVSDVLNESSYEDNVVTALVSTTGSEAARFRRFEYPPGHTVWSGARDELVAVFNRHPAVVTLGPDRLDPRVEVRLPEPPRQVAVSSDGQTAWVGLAGGDIARVQLEAGRVVQRFPCEVNTSIPFGALATLPGQPEVLVAAGVTRSGDPEVVAFRDGLPLPEVVRGLRWGGNGFFLHAAGGDRVFVSSGLNLRELRAGASGLVEVRDLDAAAWFGGAISGTPGHLVFSTGRVVDLATLGTDDHLISEAYFVADAEASILYRCLPDRTQFGGAPMAVEALAPADLSTLWRLEATSCHVRHRGGRRRFLPGGFPRETGAAPPGQPSPATRRRRRRQSGRRSGGCRGKSERPDRSQRPASGGRDRHPRGPLDRPQRRARDRTLRSPRTPRTLAAASRRAPRPAAGAPRGWDPSRPGPSLHCRRGRRPAGSRA